MLDALRTDPQIGLVGPVSNSVSGPQQVPVRYRDLSGLDGFAWNWGQQHDGQTTDLDRLVGFCLLISRACLDQVGELDEQFGLGNFEDDDYCRRARAAGFRTVVAVDSFVHHFGHRSFAASNVDFGALLQENQRKFEEKWATPPASLMPPPAPRPRFRAVAAEGGGLSLEPVAPRLSLCMIVRNNADTIRPCLESIRPWVDEIVVIDTGSTDATPKICEELGAQVRHWPWQDDFSAARNESLKDATGEWIFWMDSDDTIPADCGRQLRELVDGDHPAELLGYVLQVHCPGPGETGRHDVTVVDHVKLFRNRPDLRFEHRIHEQILPAIRRAGGEVAFTDIYVVHSGSDHSVDGRARKLERDFTLLYLDLQERPDHPFVLFNLGMTYADAKQIDEADRWLTRCLEVSQPQESHVRKAYALLLSVLYQQARHAEADTVCVRARQLYPDDKELLFRQAMLQHALGRLEEAAATYREVLEAPVDRYFTSIDVGVVGHKARQNLAVVYEEMGASAKAEAQWRAITDEFPAYQPGWLGLGENLASQADSAKISAFIQDVSRRSELQGILLGFRGKLALAQGNFDHARSILEAAIEFDPQDTVAHHALCRLVFEQSGPAEAVVTLRRLVAIDRTDASAWHNLGLAYSAREEWAAAAECFRTSLRHRPDSPETQRHLRDSLRAAGVGALAGAIRGSPDGDDFLATQ